MSQQVNSPADKEILIRCNYYVIILLSHLCKTNYYIVCNTDRDAVEKRLSILQEQGYVYSNTVNGNNSTWFIPSVNQ